MASLNRAIVMGNLGQDPELRYTQSGTAVLSMSIATTEYSQTQDGQKQEKTEWHRIVAWNKLAENCAKYLTKGRPILVEGKLQTRMWEKDGQKHYATEIVAQNIQFLGTGKPEQDARPAQGYQQPANAPSSNQGIPNANDIPNSDDIPF